MSLWTIALSALNSFTKPVGKVVDKTTYAPTEPAGSALPLAIDVASGRLLVDADVTSSAEVLAEATAAAPAYAEGQNAPLSQTRTGDLRVFVKNGSSFSIPAFNYQGFVYVGVTNNIATQTFKSGGSAGTTVATLTYTYVAAGAANDDLIASITQS